MKIIHLLLSVSVFFVLPIFAATEAFCATNENLSERSELVHTDPDKVSTLGIGEVYDESIKSIQFGIRGLELTAPKVELGSSTQLELKFDVLGDDVRNFRYSLTHCDADWTKSDLTEIDYLVSFNEGDITDYNLSFNTISDYTNYNLSLPNQYVDWKKSGNYILNVFDDVEDFVVMRLRFCVYESLVTLRTTQTRPGNVLKDRTHQEFDVSLNLRDARLENPRRSLFLTVLQNNDWRTAIYNIAPRWIRNDELQWDYQDKIVFPAMREWRSLDLRTIRTVGGRVVELNREGEDISATLFPDEFRIDYPNETRIDLNGQYVLEDFDNVRNLQGEYVRTIWSIKMLRDESIEPLYLYGALTNYQFDEQYRGKYNELTNRYMFQATIRQGAYNYAFVTPGKDGVKPDWSMTEGNTFQTENEYSFLLYYRPYGQRYDRLIAADYVQLNRG